MSQPPFTMVFNRECENVNFLFYFIIFNLSLCTYLLWDCGKTSMQDALQNKVVKSTANKCKIHGGRGRKGE